MDVNSFVDYNERIYFKAYSTNPGTYILDKLKNTIAILEENEPEYYQSGAYFRCYRDNDYIVYLPYVSNYFSILNINNNDFYYINRKKTVFYRSGAVYKGICFAFPEDGNLSDIAAVDVLKKEVYYPFGPIEGTRVVSFGECCFHDRFVYTCLNKRDTIARLDLENYSVEEIKLNNWNLQFKTIIYFDGCLYLSGEFDALVRIDEELNCEKIILFDEYLDKTHSIKQTPRFSDCRLIGDYIYFSPLKYRCVIRLNTYLKEVEYLFPIDSDCISWGISQYNECAYIVLIQGVETLGHLLIHPDGTVEEKNLFRLGNCNNLFYTLNAIFKENSEVTLNGFLDAIKARE